MKNQPTLETLLSMTPGEGASLPVAILKDLLDEYAARKRHLDRAKATLDGILENRYAGAVLETGTITVEESGYLIKVTVPKVTDWDQDMLAEQRHVLTANGEDPDQYVKAKFSISETAWKGWPDSLKAMFAQARVVKPGKPRFEISDKQKDAA